MVEGMKRGGTVEIVWMRCLLRVTFIAETIIKEKELGEGHQSKRSREDIFNAVHPREKVISCNRSGLSGTLDSKIIFTNLLELMGLLLYE